jgi:hypothetical protein
MLRAFFRSGQRERERVALRALIDLDKYLRPDRYQSNTVRGYVVEDDGWRWTPATLEWVEDFVARIVDSLPRGMSSEGDE